MVKGVAERQPVVYLPSKEILHSIADPEGITSYPEHALILEVCKALLSKDTQISVELMKQYEAAYLLVVSEDMGKMAWMARFLDIDPNILLNEGEVTETGKDTLIYRALNNESLPSFEQVYSDKVAVIYKINN